MDGIEKTIVEQQGSLKLIRVENTEGEVGYTVTGKEHTGKVFYLYNDDPKIALACYEGILNMYR